MPNTRRMKPKTSSALIVHSEWSKHPRKRTKVIVSSIMEGMASTGLVYSDSVPPRYKRKANADLEAIGNDIRRVIESYGKAQEAAARQA